MAERLRLDKLLCYLGAADTRSAARDAVRAGRAWVNGVAERDPGRVLDPTQTQVSLDGEPLAYRRWRHVMLHKPAGVITAARDPRAATVMDLLPALYAACGCLPAGRLDKDTEGLLLLTNDGALTHRVLSPRTGITKCYLAEVNGPLDTDDVLAFAQGITLTDFTALPATLTILESQPDGARALCKVQEGKYHQVKRMFGARGRAVTYLKRLSIGPLALDNALEPGAYRELTPEEVAALYTATGLPIPKE
ncbi:MAG: rRNA pseudouridine synthase [Clostridia bacterium]|nr:rRNA pseudouridine synthase [Clostridia bacterium]